MATSTEFKPPMFEAKNEPFPIRVIRWAVGAAFVTTLVYLVYIQTI